MTQYIAYPAFSGGVQSYASLASFPATADNGTVAVALDTDNLYVYSTNSTSWVLIASPHDLIDTLSSGHVFVGSASNIATDRAMTGDVSITNAGVTAVNTVTGTIPLNKGGTGTAAASANAAFNALSPLSAKGDLLSFSTVNAKLAVGSDGQMLVADSGQTLGIKWAPATVGTVTSVDFSTPAASILTISGNPITSSGTLALGTVGTSGGIPYFSSTSKLNSSALLTANQLILGGGAGTTPASLGNLGTTTTVLHGNAGGAPSFGAVVLTTDVSGALPIGNGGTGQTTKAPAFDALSPMSASGDIIYGGASGTGTRLAKGSDTQVLTLASGLPSWAAPAITIAAFGSTPNSNGGSVSGVQLTLQPADGTNPGGVSTAAQTIAGAKTFSSAVIVGNNSTGDSNLGTISSVSLGAYYVTSFQITFNTGAWTSSHTLTFTCVKIGNIVTLTVPQAIFAASAATTSISAGTDRIPSGLRPTTTILSPYIVEDNSAILAAPGRIDITSAGAITFNKDLPATANFTASGNAGPIGPFSVTYSTT